jgi:hypothetical protein
MILHGVDFSGADSGGSHKIRVATRALRAAPPSSGASARAVARAHDGGARGGGTRQDSAETAVERMDRRGLLERIRASAHDGASHFWRIDAPVGMPAATIEAHEVEGDWLAVAQWMESFGGPRPWRAALRSVERMEPRRATDHDARTPMAPMNLRVFKQTWTLVCEVLLPLAREGQVSIEPMRPVPGARVAVGEGCPASVLQRRGWPSRAYKGEGEPPQRVREEILRRLRGVGVRTSAVVQRAAAEDVEGDIVDALILTTDPCACAVPREATVEGWVW